MRPTPRSRWGRRAPTEDAAAFDVRGVVVYVCVEKVEDDVWFGGVDADVRKGPVGRLNSEAATGSGYIMNDVDALEEMFATAAIDNHGTACFGGVIVVEDEVRVKVARVARTK